MLPHYGPDHEQDFLFLYHYDNSRVETQVFKEDGDSLYSICQLEATIIHDHTYSKTERAICTKFYWHIMSD